MKYNYNKLCGKIVEVCGSQKEFASRIGVTPESITHKLTNKSKFKQDEIYNICSILGIERNKLCDYFFEPDVR